MSIYARDLRPGDRVSEYVLEERVGHGGFGDVWRARHHVWKDRLVAVKVPADAAKARVLKREGAIQEVVRHPNAVEVLGLDPEHDPPYLVMEFVDGESLRARLDRERRLAPADALTIARDVLSGLAAAHERGVVHRDLKPENVLLARGGPAKITDFGLGRMRDEERERLVLSGALDDTRDLGIEGTLAYMAPEQHEPGRPIDARADVYAFGILLFEMLTGARPEGGEAPSDLVAGLDPRIDAIFRRCYCRLEKRYKSGREALAALEPVLACYAAGAAGATHVLDAAGLEPLGEARGPFGPLPARIALPRGPVTLGSTRDADIQIDAPLVARSHATIEWREGAFYIRDNGTPSGTYLLPAVVPAGTRLEKHLQKVGHAPQRLAEGVVIVLGAPEVGEPPFPPVPPPGRSCVAFRFRDGPPAPDRIVAEAPAGPAFDPRALALVGALACGLGAAVVGHPALVLAAVLLVLLSLGRGSVTVSAPPPHAGPAFGRPAGIALRTIAFLLDLALFAIVLKKAWFPAAWFVYDWLTTALFGATAGKWLLGMRVVRTDGRPIGVGHALLRSIGKLVTLLTLGAGFFLGAITASKQALHDFIAESMVLRDPRCE